MTIGVRSRATDYVALAKPRLNLLVVMSAVAGYAMAHGDTTDFAGLGWMVVGTGLVSGGASAINQVIERETDGLMRRTRQRPLPDGRLTAVEALAFAGILSVSGLFVLAAGVNLLSAMVALATLASYAVVYTPLKKRTSFATVIGAIPGALPPVIGWAAAADALSQGAWVLFGIVFLWQLPHFLALAWMYREDYRKAGIVVLPSSDPDGSMTGRQMVANLLALVPASLLPCLAGIAGTAYFVGAILLSVGFLAFGIAFAWNRSQARARRVFLASLAYLPALLTLLAVAR